MCGQPQEHCCGFLSQNLAPAILEMTSEGEGPRSPLRCRFGQKFSLTLLLCSWLFSQRVGVVPHRWRMEVLTSPLRVNVWWRTYRFLNRIWYEEKRLGRPAWAVGDRGCWRESDRAFCLWDTSWPLAQIYLTEAHELGPFFSECPARTKWTQGWCLSAQWGAPGFVAMFRWQPVPPCHMEGINSWSAGRQSRQFWLKHNILCWLPKAQPHPSSFKIPPVKEHAEQWLSEKMPPKPQAVRPIRWLAAQVIFYFHPFLACLPLSNMLLR